MVRQNGVQGEVLTGCGAEGWWLGLGTTLERCDPVANSGKLTLFLPLFHGLSRSLSLPL